MQRSRHMLEISCRRDVRTRLEPQYWLFLSLVVSLLKRCNIFSEVGSAQEQFANLKPGD